MLSLIFDVDHEWYCLHFRPGSLTLKQTIIFQLKMLVNLFAAAVLFSAPVITVMLIAEFLK